MIKLRDYQIDMITRTRAALARNRRVILQAPTGAGKTAVACHMMAEARAKGMSTFFMVHQNELLKQTATSLWENKIDHGLIASGKARSPHPIQLASVMTLKNRLGHYPDPGLIIIDESHRALAPTYQAIVEHYPDAYVVGLTATPERTDGKGLGHLFGDIVTGPSIRYLMSQGHLCDYEMYCPPQQADTSNIKTTAGDYDSKQAEKELNRPSITGDAVAHYKRLAYGRPTVVMCTTVKHADDVAQMYREAGIPAQSIHSKSENRDDILDRFERGQFAVLTSVSLMIEGVDMPFLSCVQWLRPTQSLVVYMQGNGRGLRPHHSKSNLLILDHVGNYSRHGMPCSDREWSLSGRKKRVRGPVENLSVQVCQECYFSFQSGVRVCPHCGAEVPFRDRVLETVDGELIRIEKAAAEAEAKRTRRQEQGQARSIDDLVMLGIRRGMKNPAAWAANVHASRENRRPTPAEFNRARSVYRASA